MQRVAIVGASGQDGRILWDQLAAGGAALVGLSRGAVRSHHAGWHEPVDITSAAAVQRFVKAFQPERLYYLAAHHHSSQDAAGESADLWGASWAIHLHGFQNFLEAARLHQPALRVFYASSSRVFGDTAPAPQNESTPLRPTDVYGVTKAAGMLTADYYRRAHGLFVACGILYNHESPLRAAKFVSRRIADGLAALKAGRAERLELGSLDARVDWGYAPDYTRAMRLMLDAARADDYVVATGETHSVREMVEIAAATIGVDWRTRVVEQPGILRRNAQELCGDAARLRQATGWRPEVGFAEMVRRLAEHAVSRGVSAPSS